MKTERQILVDLIGEEWTDHLVAEACGKGTGRYWNDECAPFADIEGSHEVCGVWQEHEAAEHRKRIGEEEYQRRIRRWIG